MTPTFESGTRVEHRYSHALGTVVCHAQQHVSGSRRILVRWDATPVAPVRETIVSSLNLKEHN